MNNDQKIKISKFLSLVLRHQPEIINLELDANGWADIAQLIQKSAGKGVVFSIDALHQIVIESDKQRFCIDKEMKKIRANQGHSVEVDVELKVMTPPKFLFHGTSEKNIASILENGIHKMNRLYVHLSDEKETATKVGTRHGKPKILTISSGQMHQDGISFYLSANHVWLVDFVDKKYISE